MLKGWKQTWSRNPLQKNYQYWTPAVFLYRDSWSTLFSTTFLSFILPSFVSFFSSRLPLQTKMFFTFPTDWWKIGKTKKAVRFCKHLTFLHSVCRLSFYKVGSRILNLNILQVRYHSFCIIVTNQLCFCNNSLNKHKMYMKPFFCRLV